MIDKNGLFFPSRMIHLDFHTGPDIPDVGNEFDPERFAQTFVEAHVDSVTVFAKCHHGHLYYDTDRAERHPGLLRDLDLLGEQIEALHREGIRAPIYLSVQVDEYAANTHPEWVAQDESSRKIKRGIQGALASPFEAGWQILDMSTPYQDYLAEQLDEVLRTYGPVDGMFLDMCWDQPSTTRWAQDGMRAAGLDPRSAQDRDVYARQVALSYMARFSEMIRPHMIESAAQSVWFNSRPKTNLYQESAYLTHIEVESLPTGGWGYAYLPYVGRFVRPLSLPILSHTGRFHTHWGDNSSLKSAAALKYECCQILSLSITPGVGDLLHPGGVPSKAVYDRIGEVYDYVESCQPYMSGGTLVSEIAVIVDPGLGDDPGPAVLGAVRALQQLRQQFDIVPTQSNLAGYRVVVVPETTVVTPDMAVKLSDQLAAGKAVIIVGDALADANGRPVLDELGIELDGRSPYTHTFMRPLAGGTATDGYDSVVYERGWRMRTAGSQALYGVVEPYFERTYDHFSGHMYTAPNRLSEYAAVACNGKAISIAEPLLTSFGIHGNEHFRKVLGEVLDHILPDPLLKAGGPAHLETTVTQTPTATVVNLLSYLPTRIGTLDLVQDPVPLIDCPVSVRTPTQPTTVTLQPLGSSVPWTYDGTYTTSHVTLLDGHTLLVIEAEGDAIIETGMAGQDNNRSPVVH